jgi:hypothetical protein
MLFSRFPATIDGLYQWFWPSVVAYIYTPHLEELDTFFLLTENLCFTLFTDLSVGTPAVR